jgi:phospholipid/cholesterol/gamma-HCH transport system substrate-binding protein
MRRNAIETVMGAVVLIVAGLFIYFASTMVQMGSVAGYAVTASFFKLGDLGVGSDVRISGIKVGTITGRQLDPQSYNAVVTMTIADAVQLPEDTVASITSDGLLGGKYLRLEPGRSTTILKPGGQIRETRSYRSLEDQVGEIIYLATDKPGADAPAANTGER